MDHQREQYSIVSSQQYSGADLELAIGNMQLVIVYCYLQTEYFLFCKEISKHVISIA